LALSKDDHELDLLIVDSESDVWSVAVKDR